MNFNIKSLLVIGCIGLFVTSCSDNLDIAPITQKSANNFFSTEAEVESAIEGAYSQLQSSGLYGLDIVGVGEIPGEDAFEEIAANDGGRFGQLDDFSTNASNDLVGDIWRESYKGVQRVNVILNRINGIEYENASTKSQRIGELHFLRGLLYFNLVRLYGDVPLVIKETTNPSDFFGQGRNAVSNIYAQIETDLKAAITSLPTSRVVGRPAKGAAQALLADVQMNQGNYSDAVTNLMEVVKSGKYSLMPSTADIFGIANEGNNEILFEVQFKSGLNGNSEGNSLASQFRPSGTTANAKGHNLPTEQFVGFYTDDDTRRKDYVDKEDANPFYFTTKYEVSSTGPNDSGSDYYVIRYADVLLKLAEALNQSGSSDAVRYLNMVRNRAGLSNSSATTKEQLSAAIDMERRLEFIGEGHRWFDLKRTGKAVETMNKWFSDNNQSVTISEDNLILPIPQSQLDTDPAITQNSGY